MSNINKLILYFKRNGIKNTYYAAKERLFDKGVPYTYVPVSEEELLRQKKESQNFKTVISLLVPVYETPEKYLREMIESCLSQSYEKWELVLADASKTQNPQQIIKSYTDSRIVYEKLDSNDGISANTNKGLMFCKGDYIALLDHDDLLTSDALYEVAKTIEEGIKNNAKPLFIYSDEDKCNGDATVYYDPNVKTEFNLDYLFSNNYICHLSVFEAENLKNLKFRPEYDGAQDYDVILRTVKNLIAQNNENRISHISKVLYHWRCHENSTAANPASKNYAYDAGRRALEDYFGGSVPVKNTLHKGFYHVEFGEKLFSLRPEVGAIGGFVFKSALRGNISEGKITGGIYDENGLCPYKNRNKYYSGGFLHRAHCTMDAYALDIRNLQPSPEFTDLWSEVLFNFQTEWDLVKSSFNGKKELKKAYENCLFKWNKYFAEEIRKKGKLLLFDPYYQNGSVNYAMNTKVDSMLPVSVVVPNFNGMEYLKPCLESIYSSDMLPMEVIVVDNGSTDNSTEGLLELYPDLKLLRHERNLGFTGAVNHGIVASKAPYVFLLNNDTLLEKDTISNLVKSIEKNENIFSVGAMMISMDDRETIDNVGDCYNLLGYARNIKKGKSRFNISADKPRNVFTSCAGAALYRADILRKIGLFDDRHFAYLEDVDLGYRARIFGYKNICEPKAVVYHKGSAATGSKHNAFKVSHSSQNSVLLPLKNMPFLQYVINLPFLCLGVLIKFAFFCLKGLGGEYIKGIGRGIKMSLSADGRAHHIPFRFRNLWNYIKIEGFMIDALRKS